MDAALERIVSADEEARVRVDTARASAAGRVEAARAQVAEQRRAAEAEAAAALDEEVERIRTEAEVAAADRSRRREEWVSARQAAKEPLLSAAADAYVRFVRGEEAP